MSDVPFDPEKEPDEMKDPDVRANVKCTIFFAYTSNMISCGMREPIRFLVQHKMVMQPYILSRLKDQSNGAICR